jgi:hypothetical protein
MKQSLTIILIFLATVGTNPGVGFSQQPNPSTNSQEPAKADAHALKIRRKLAHLGLGQDVTVKLRSGKDYHGGIVAIGDDDFKIDEVDQRQLVSINYSDTKRVDQGYRTKSLATGKRPNPHTARIIALAVIGVLVVLLVVVTPKN